ncbi:MAG: DUF1700 domain-containing protein [Bacilli bacterium]
MMNKNEFLLVLKSRLKAFKKEEVDGIIAFYDELIEEKKENGLDEKAAIESFGTIENIISKTTADLVINRSNNQTSSPLKNFWIILGICASPILIPIGIALGAVAFALVVVVLSLLISFVASAVAILVSLIPMAISMVISGVQLPIILLTIGLAMIALAMIGYLSLVTFQLGKKALAAINTYFSKRIKRKTEEK